MIVPSPLQYLASHAIALVAGAVSVVAVHMYGKRQRAAGARDAANGTR
jgi:hypothetical protein